MQYFLLAGNDKVTIAPKVRSGTQNQEWSHEELRAQGMKELSASHEESWKDAAWAFRQEFLGGLSDAPQQPVRF